MLKDIDYILKISSFKWSLTNKYHIFNRRFENKFQINIHLCYNSLRVFLGGSVLSNELIEAIEEFEKQKGIPKEKILASLEDAIKVAYKKKISKLRRYSC